MSQAAMVRSIASARDEIGVRAARHLDTTFRAIMRPPAAEHQPSFIRVITGEPHPLGNAAIISNPNDPAATRAAAVPLQESGLPAAVLFTEGFSADAAQALEAMGFAHQGAMPAMAVDIDAMGDTTLPAGYKWARVGAGSEGSAWANTMAATYGTELRSEGSDRARTIINSEPQWYEETAQAVFGDGLEDTISSQSNRKWARERAAWKRRRWTGKALSVARLLKATFTFQGGADYLAWKIERHSGVPVKLNWWQRRHPILAAIWLYPKLKLKGAFR